MHQATIKWEKLPHPHNQGSSLVADCPLNVVSEKWRGEYLGKSRIRLRGSCMVNQQSMLIADISHIPLADNCWSNLRFPPSYFLSLVPAVELIRDIVKASNFPRRIKNCICVCAWDPNIFTSGITCGVGMPLVDCYLWRDDGYSGRRGVKLYISCTKLFNFTWPEVVAESVEHWSCWRPGFRVGQHYKIVMTVFCHKAVPVLVWP